MADTAARVDFVIANNATWDDPVQFGTPGDTSWSLAGQGFRCDIKGSPYAAAPLLALTSGTGKIVVDDPVLRIIHFNVPYADFVSVLPPGHSYYYDLIMLDNGTPPLRVQLMEGTITVEQGITG